MFEGSNLDPEIEHARLGLILGGRRYIAGSERVVATPKHSRGRCYPLRSLPVNTREAHNMVTNHPQSPRDRSPSIACQQVERARELFPNGRVLRIALAPGARYPHALQEGSDDRSLDRATAWQKAVTWVKEERPIGALPGDFGMVVVDVDVDLGAEIDGTTWCDRVIAAHGAPMAMHPTQTDGHFHLWYEHPGEGVSLPKSIILDKRKCGKKHNKIDVIGSTKGHGKYVRLYRVDKWLDALETVKGPIGGTVLDPGLFAQLDPKGGKAPAQPSNVISFRGEPEVKPTGADMTLPEWSIIRAATEWLYRERKTWAHDEWIEIGQCVHFESEGSPGGFEIFDSFSRNIEGYPGAGARQSTRDKWDSFGKRTGRNRKRIYQLAQLEGWSNPRSDIPEVNPVEEFDNRDPFPTVAADPINGDGPNGSHTTEADRVERILAAMGVWVRIDADKDQMQFSHDGRTWHPLERDSEIAFLRDKMERHIANGETFRKVVGAIDRLNRNLDALSERNRNRPLCDYVRRNMVSWDGIERSDKWISEAFGIENSPSLAFVSRLIPCAMLARLFKPGILIDVMPFLIGPQNIGKSSVLKQFIPEQFRDDAFRDRIDYRWEDQTLFEQFGSAWLIEDAELRNIGKASSEKVKSFISQTSWTFRKPYGRRSVTWFRRDFLIGTSNNAKVLPGDEHDRRFFPVVIPSRLPLVGNKVPAEVSRDARAYVDKHLWQIYAEAAYLLGGDTGIDATKFNREPLTVAESLEPARAEASRDHQEVDEICLDWCRGLQAPQNPEVGYTMGDLAEQWQGDGHRFDQKTVGRYLRINLQWEKRKGTRRSDRTARWYPPADWEPIESGLRRRAGDDFDHVSEFDNLDFNV